MSFAATFIFGLCPPLRTRRMSIKGCKPLNLISSCFPLEIAHRPLCILHAWKSPGKGTHPPRLRFSAYGFFRPSFLPPERPPSRSPGLLPHQIELRPSSPAANDQPYIKEHRRRQLLFLEREGGKPPTTIAILPHPSPAVRRIAYIHRNLT